MEHLSDNTIDFSSVATRPQGVVNYPVENGIAVTENIPAIDPVTGLQQIDAAGNPVFNTVPRPAQEILDDSYTLCATTIGHAAVITPLDLDLGSPPFSEVRTEHLEEHVAQAQRDARIIEQQDTLRLIAATTADPTRADLIVETLESDVDLAMAPAYQTKLAHQRRLEERVAAGTATAHDRSEIKRMERELKGMRKLSGVGVKGRTKAILGMRSELERVDNGARRSMRNTGASLTKVADTVGDRGRNRRDIARERERVEGESLRLENLVATKGSIITVPEDYHEIGTHPRGLNLEPGRRYVVMDLEPTPVQAFRHNRVPAVPAHGTPPDPRTAIPGDDGMLHNVFINVAPLGQPVQLEPLLRDDIHQGGTAYQGLTNGTLGQGHSSDGNLYYEDGTPVNVSGKATVDYPPGALLPAGSGKVAYIEQPRGSGRFIQRVEVAILSEDSFTPKEDRVILRPLLSGEEAVRLLYSGQTDPLNPLTIQETLAEVDIKLSELASLLRGEEIEVVTDQDDRVEILNDHFIFDESIEPPGGALHPPTETVLRPPYDQASRTGHFRNYSHIENDPRTRSQREREAVAAEHAHRRHRAWAADRREKALTRTRNPL